MPLQLWAGPECTVNRVGDRWFDECEATGFAHRLDDLDRLAGLGVRRIRFPLLWERTVLPGDAGYRWDWSDLRMHRLRLLGVEPIVGLLHHGSGPAWTHLLDPAFPRLLARYAGEVARRYPDAPAYTPVNEPLTTARFAALYGVWYPHTRDDRSFVRALLNEIHGTVLAMREIRRVNPRAELVQTDDLGAISSTPALHYQADFENHRRWLSWDLLCGRVDRHHPMWDYLVRHGAAPAELQALADAPCPPDIVGINGYVTSERMLDERVHLHDPAFVGGNGRDRYVDVEAVRVAGNVIGGFAASLPQACERYGLPVAITEVHLGCSRDEQLRWLQQAWRAAQDARASGHDVRAVTCWAAFGTYDWDSLVTRADGHYEPGLWDVRSHPPRPTALAALARQLADGESPAHPVLAGPGWWERKDRITHPAWGEVEARPVTGRPVLITGASGTLGRAVARACAQRGLPYRLLRRAEMDVADPASVESALNRWRPWAVVNTAGYVRVDDAEADARQWRENADGPAVLAAACARHHVRMVTFSSDLVFGGDTAMPYVESDQPNPLNAYGRAKHEAERRVLAAAPDALVVRTAAFFGPWDRHNFVTLALDTMARGEVWPAAADQVVSPTYVPDLVHATLDLLVDGEAGLWHLANEGVVSWAGLARMAARLAGLDESLVRELPGRALGQVAPRPAFAALCSERGRVMPALEDALARYMAHRARGDIDRTAGGAARHEVEEVG